MGPAWAGARLRMPFPLQAQSAARATGEWGREAGGDMRRVGWGGAGPSELGGAPPPLARIQALSWIAPFETLAEGAGCSPGGLPTCDLRPPWSLATQINPK